MSGMNSSMLDDHDAIIRAEARIEALKEAAERLNNSQAGNVIDAETGLLKTIIDIVLADEPKDDLGSGSNPYRGTFNSVCFQRHDNDLRLAICERDDGFEIGVTAGLRPTILYTVNPNGDIIDTRDPINPDAIRQECQYRKTQRIYTKDGNITIQVCAAIMSAGKE